jgi:hypothetical protein
MKKFKQYPKTFILMTLLFLSYCSYKVFQHYIENPKILANMLNLKELPKSVKINYCKSCALTDVIVICEIDLDSKDSMLLMSGREFEEPNVPNKHGITVHWDKNKPSNFNCGVEPSFEQETYLWTMTKEMINGGILGIVLNKEKTKAVIDYYEE